MYEKPGVTLQGLVAVLESPIVSIELKNKAKDVLEYMLYNSMPNGLLKRVQNQKNLQSEIIE